MMICFGWLRLVVEVILLLKLECIGSGKLVMIRWLFYDLVWLSLLVRRRGFRLICVVGRSFLFDLLVECCSLLFIRLLRFFWLLVVILFDMIWCVLLGILWFGVVWFCCVWRICF